MHACAVVVAVRSPERREQVAVLRVAGLEQALAVLAVADHAALLVDEPAGFRVGSALRPFEQRWLVSRLVRLAHGLVLIVEVLEIELHRDELDAVARQRLAVHAALHAAVDA